MAKQKTAWDFVEEFYPNYYCAQEIADADDLKKMLDGEMESDGRSEPQIKADLIEAEHKIYVKAIEAYLNSHT